MKNKKRSTKIERKKEKINWVEFSNFYRCLIRWLLVMRLLFHLRWFNNNTYTHIPRGLFFFLFIHYLRILCPSYMYRFVVPMIFITIFLLLFHLLFGFFYVRCNANCWPVCTFMFLFYLWRSISIFFVFLSMCVCVCFHYIVILIEKKKISCLIKIRILM